MLQAMAPAPPRTRSAPTTMKSIARLALRPLDDGPVWSGSSVGVGSDSGCEVTSPLSRRRTGGASHCPAFSSTGPACTFCRAIAGGVAPLPGERGAGVLLRSASGVAVGGGAARQSASWGPAGNSGVEGGRFEREGRSGGAGVWRGGGVVCFGDSPRTGGGSRQEPVFTPGSVGGRGVSAGSAGARGNRSETWLGGRGFSGAGGDGGAG